MSNVAQEEEQQIGSDTDSDVTPTATTAAAHKADLEYSEGGEGVAGVLLETAESRRPAAPALSLRPGLQNDALLLTTVAARETPESSTIEHPKVDQSNGGDDDNERESTAKHLLPPLPSSSSTSSSYKPPKRAPVNKSARIGSLQTIFTDSQKIAYVGLCYLSLHLHKSSRLANKTQIKARRSFDEWAKMLMEKLYAYIGVSLEEQLMMVQLAEHGLIPIDLAKTLIDDAFKAAKDLRQRQEAQQFAEQEALENGLPPPALGYDGPSPPIPSSTSSSTTNIDSTTNRTASSITPVVSDPDAPSDIRYTVLSHLFILCIADGIYDARERVLLRTVAKYLSIPWTDVIQLEINIAEQLRVQDYLSNLRKDEFTVGKRNLKDSKGRWLFMGLATLAGGAVIGLTAGLAAPLIGTGIAAALGGLGVSGAAGVGTFMGSATGLALITTGGVTIGGGLSGAKMLKRTRGVSEFEFLTISDALKEIAENKITRTEERRKRRKKRATDRQDEKDARIAAASSKGGSKKSLSSMRPSATSSAAPSPIRSSSAVGSASSSVAPSIVGSESIDIPRGRAADGGNASTPLDDNLETGSVLWEAATTVVDEPLGEGGVGVNYIPESGVKSVTIGAASKSGAAEPQTSGLTKLLADEGGAEQLDQGPLNSHTSPDTPAPPRQTNVLITISGWMTYGKDDFTLPWSTLVQNIYGDQYALVWESKDLKELGSALKILASEIGSFLFQQGIQYTLLPVLMAGLTGPMWALKLTYLLDNPWGIGLSKAQRAGRVMADMLIAQVQENRPVTLMGFSLGARLIYFCLLELAAKGAHGIVEEVYLFGCPVMSTKKEWLQISSVVSGKIVNGYQKNDWVLGVLYRASSAAWADVPGLGPVDGIPGVENVKLDDVINGHLEYRLGMPKILQAVGFEINADYFDDEDDEEERERLEIIEERRIEKEEQLKEKMERAQRKKDEEERRKLEKKKRAEEAAAAKLGSSPSKGSASSSWFRSRAHSKSSDSGSNQDPDEPEFTPKELSSTMPPLVIKSSRTDEDLQQHRTYSTDMLRSSSLQSLASSYAEDDYLDDFGDGIRPKEIQSTLPTLIIDPHDLELFEKFDLKGEALEAELRKHMDSSALMASGPGDLADANREDESSKPIVSIESLGEQNMAANASTTADSSTFSDSSKQQPPHLPIEFKEGNNLAVAVSSATRDLSSMNLESASSYDPLKTAPPSSSLIQEGSGADCAQEPSTAISQLSSACDIVDLSLMSAASPASNLPLMKPIEPKSPEVNPWN